MSYAQQPAPLLIIACGALSKELIALKKANNWKNVKVQCLPADLHNRPELIPERVETMLRKTEADYPHRFIAYADCGTGGALDKVCERHQVERLPGAHCYAFFAGLDEFDAMMEESLGTFFLTDFMVRHFDRIIWQGMGLDKHPELKEMYFQHYERVLYISQVHDPELLEKAQSQAARLGLDFDYQHTGYNLLEKNISEQVLVYNK